MAGSNWKQAVWQYSAFLILCMPAGLSAQACIGAPMPEGAFALGIGAGRTTGLKDYGIGLQSNLRGPVSLLAAYRWGDPAETSAPLHNFVVGASYDLLPASSDWSVCPRASVTHSRFNGMQSNVDTNANTTVFGIGIALGRTFAAGGGVTVAPYVMPEVVLVQTRGEANAFGQSIDLDDNNNERQVTAGVTVDVGRFMFTGSSAFSSLANSDPFYTVGLGLRL